MTIAICKMQLILLTLLLVTVCDALGDKERIQTLENEVSDLKAAFLKQEKLVSVLADKCNERSNRFVMDESPVIAFTGAVAPEFVPNMHHGETVKFETTVTNFGDGYNNQTGVFVVPTSGLYMFSCSILDEHHSVNGLAMVHAEIVKGTKVLGRVFAHAEVDQYRDQGANTVF
ncbi:hypothetical protein MAR_024706, partial [Mya arenaria]